MAEKPGVTKRVENPGKQKQEKTKREENPSKGGRLEGKKFQGLGREVR